MWFFLSGNDIEVTLLYTTLKALLASKSVVMILKFAYIHKKNLAQGQLVLLVF